MSCPICSHTMHRLNDGNPVHFWCPRCGTMLDRHEEGHENITAPALVGRCRSFAAQLPGGVPQRWHTLGIHESIVPEGER